MNTMPSAYAVAIKSRDAQPNVPLIVSSCAIVGMLCRFNASSIAGGKDGGAKGERLARLLRLIAPDRATTSADIRLTGCLLSEIFVRLVTAIHKPRTARLGLAQGSVTYSLEPIDEVRILTRKALFCCLKMYSTKKFRFF
jgi:hypothetical protein